MNKPKPWQEESKNRLDESLKQLPQEELNALRQRRLLALNDRTVKNKTRYYAAAVSSLAIAASIFLFVGTPLTPVQTDPQSSHELADILDSMDVIEDMDMLMAIEALSNEV